MEYRSAILIVDDSPQGLKTLEALLSPENYQLYFSSSGPDAIEKAAKVHLDLILLDVMMPYMDGFEVCRHLRANSCLAEIPIMMITALDDRESRLEGLAAGADDFISKPFDRAELRMRVRTITRLNRYRRLMNERTRFQQLIELSPDGILIVDAAGNIHLANPSMVRLLRAENRETVMGQNLLTFVVCDHEAHCMDGLRRVISTPSQAVCLEIVLQCSDGTTVPVEVHAGYMLWNDAPTAQIIVRDITERKRAECENMRLMQELAERERRLHDLVEKLLVSQEEERRRVAYELHDGLAQVASSAHQHWQTFASLYRPRSERSRQVLSRALELSQRVVKEARHVIAGLRPTVLDDFGLASALRLEVETLRAEGWSITYEEASLWERLPPSIETTFFRIAQEALNNIRKHARTTRVRLGLFCQEHTIRLEVQDWGCGFDPSYQLEGSGPGERIGLLGMQERMALLGGTLSVDSHPGMGTLIVAEASLVGLEEGKETPER
ncbi:MAG: response regulator [Chloroflexaceae bacterium]|nr:response regulator [Chloroflexaceae bacterium]